MTDHGLSILFCKMLSSFVKVEKYWKIKSIKNMVVWNHWIKFIECLLLLIYSFNYQKSIIWTQVLSLPMLNWFAFVLFKLSHAFFYWNLLTHFIVYFIIIIFLFLHCRQLLHDCGIGVPIDPKDTPVVNQHRVLLFCQLKSMLNIVENDLLK